MGDKYSEERKEAKAMLLKAAVYETACAREKAREMYEQAIELAPSLAFADEMPSSTIKYKQGSIEDLVKDIRERRLPKSDE